MEEFSHCLYRPDYEVFDDDIFYDEFVANNRISELQGELFLIKPKKKHIRAQKIKKRTQNEIKIKCQN